MESYEVTPVPGFSAMDERSFLSFLISQGKLYIRKKDICMTTAALCSHLVFINEPQKYYNQHHFQILDITRNSISTKRIITIYATP